MCNLSDFIVNYITFTASTTTHFHPSPLRSLACIEPRHRTTNTLSQSYTEVAISNYVFFCFKFYFKEILQLFNKGKTFYYYYKLCKMFIISLKCFYYYKTCKMFIISLVHIKKYLIKQLTKQFFNINNLCLYDTFIWQKSIFKMLWKCFVKSLRKCFPNV